MHTNDGLIIRLRKQLHFCYSLLLTRRVAKSNWIQNIPIQRMVLNRRSKMSREWHLMVGFESLITFVQYAILLTLSLSLWKWQFRDDYNRTPFSRFSHFSDFPIFWFFLDFRFPIFRFFIIGIGFCHAPDDVYEIWLRSVKQGQS